MSTWIVLFIGQHFIGVDCVAWIKSFLVPHALLSMALHARSPGVPLDRFVGIFSVSLLMI
jgi:hypothetical protein